MNLYRVFILCFFLSIIAFLVFMTQYIQVLSGIFTHTLSSGQQNPEQIFRLLFNPILIISGVIMGAAGLAFKIIGIVFVAQKKELPGGEQTLWILGFIFIGFVTAIVFMALAKTKQWVVEINNKYNT
ncbi:hypothetical protein F0919_06215 [Taibaiella lutea]|uniref:Uncharacterized protein n=1 Tax=Taibaiella lutea TaxID=2608001 RepID=A0A5M6CQK1_9BACT|nr:hypothetical protein [Taibaiella lutea]KAA5537263.1 hypothetical protein F0919_06215 [Taibaiella lutea]